ncbi:MAG TPA: hypothetical protein VMM78_19045 [Thermomicrobiales bacterium]|nr:hypothetical protein [Thermomicrobiales bacterium]
MLEQALFDDLNQVLEQMPAVGDLLGFRRTSARHFDIRVTPATGNDLDARMLAQPGRDRLDLRVW